MSGAHNLGNDGRINSVSVCADDEIRIPGGFDESPSGTEKVFLPIQLVRNIHETTYRNDA